MNAENDAGPEVPKKKILVVEDDEVSRLLLVKFCAKGGFQALTASNGIEALAVVKNDSPDLIFTDLWMPHMDGDEFVRQLRGMGIQTPVVFISGSADSEAMERLRRISPNLMPKPLFLEEFLALARHLLSSQSRP